MQTLENAARQAVRSAPFPSVTAAIIAICRRGPRRCIVDHDQREWFASEGYGKQTMNLAAAVLMLALPAAAQTAAEPAASASQSPADDGAAAVASAGVPPIAAPAVMAVRGVHLTGWAVGAP